MELDPQIWMQLGVVGGAFGWLLNVVTTRLQQAIDCSAEALQQLSRRVQVNMLLVARVTGQDAAQLEHLLSDGGRRWVLKPEEFIAHYLPDARRYHQERHGLPAQPAAGCILNQRGLQAHHDTFDQHADRQVLLRRSPPGRLQHLGCQRQGDGRAAGAVMPPPPAAPRCRRRSRRGGSGPGSSAMSC